MKVFSFIFLFLLLPLPNVFAVMPAAPTNPSPADQQIDVDTDVTITWTFGAGTVTYSLLFEAANPPTAVVAGGSAGGTGSHPETGLDSGTTYYWQVIESDSSIPFPNVKYGPIWQFTTVAGSGLPGDPHSPSPSNGETDVYNFEPLTWEFGSDTDTYVLYFDTENPPDDEVASGTAPAYGFYNPGQMDLMTTYYWQVVASNDAKGQTAGPIWSFTVTNSVGIGDGTSTGKHLPFDPAVAFNYAQILYFQQDINISDMLIDRIYFLYNGYSSWSTNISVYMGHSTLTSITDWIPVANLQQVFEGDISVTSVYGWVEIILDVPFVYNNVNNLIVAVDENTPTFFSDLAEFFCTESLVKGTTSIYFGSSGMDIAPRASSGQRAKSALLSEFYPNILFSFTPVPPDPEVAVFPNSIDCGLTELSATPVYKKIEISNIGSGSLDVDSVSLTGTDAGQFTLDDSNSYSVTLNTGEVITLSVAFTPTSTGSKNANVTIIDDQAKVSTNIPLSGNSQVFTMGSFPWSESFDDDFPPFGWSLTGDEIWQLYNDGSGDKHPYCYFSGWEGKGSAVLRSPKLDFSDLRAGTIRFLWSHEYTAGSPGDKLEVMIVDAAQTWEVTLLDKVGTELDSQDGASQYGPGSFVQYYAPVPQQALGQSEVYLEFRGTGDQGSNLFVDELIIEAIPSVIISEIAWSGTADNPDHEWIELYNRTDAAIDIGNWSMTGIVDGNSTTFSASDIDGYLTKVIPPHGYLIYGDAPDIFQTGATVHIWDSSMDLDDAIPYQLVLYDGPDTSSNIVDRANDNSGSWCAGTSTSHESMERVDLFAQGDNCLNWATNSVNVPDVKDKGGNSVNGTPGMVNSERIVLSTIKSGDNVVLSWPTTSGIGSYHVLVSTSLNTEGGFDVMTDSVSPPYIHIDAGIDNQDYYYIIRDW